MLDFKDPSGSVDALSVEDSLLWMTRLLLFSSIDMSDLLIVESDAARWFIA